MSAVANAVLPASQSGADRSIDELDAAICRLASRVNAVNYRLLVLVREFDYRGEHYFVRADGRAIPRCGYRTADYTDDAPNPSMEVREPRGVYRLTTAAAPRGSTSRQTAAGHPRT